MMKKSLFCMTAALFALPTVTSAASPYFSLKDGDGFKRFQSQLVLYMSNQQEKPSLLGLTLLLRKMSNLRSEILK